MDLYDQGGGSFLPPSSTPRAVEGGIRLQSRRGGTQWWSRRWLAALEAGAVGERLAQGLDDARRGRVLELEVELGVLRARVQGTRREPHDTRMQLAAIDQLAWLRIARSLAAHGASRAELLAGQMPDSVDATFRREGVSLFPVLEDDLRATCTCRDWSTPCRHLLAASLLVSEVLDADPLAAFRLRGIEPALLLAIASGDHAGARPAHGPAGGSGRPSSPASAESPPPTLDEAAAAGAIVVSLDPPPIDAPLVRILGAPPLWRGADSFEPAMRRLYARVASDPRAIDLALGVRGQGGSTSSR